MQIHARADMLGAYREDLPGGIRAPSRVYVTAEPNGSDLAHRVELTVELIGGRFVATDLRCRQVEGGPPIDSAALRAVPVSEIVFRALRPYVLVGGPDDTYAEGKRHPLDVGPADAEDGPTDATLHKVAAVYQLAYMTGGRPTQTVSEVFEVKRGTVGRWVMRCRERGFLGPAAPGKAGERRNG